MVLCRYIALCSFQKKKKNDEDEKKDINIVEEEENILELFLSKKYYYPNGFDMSTYPESSHGTIVSIANDSYIKIHIDGNGNGGGLINIRITKK